MKKEVLKDTVEKTRALIDAPTCSAETKAAAQRWLAAVGTEAEQAETKAYIAELEEDIMPIDSLIGFARSAQGAAYFGAETAAGIAAHAEEIKAAGAKYCDCPACAIVEAILAEKGRIARINQEEGDDRMIRHIVMFRFADRADGRTKAENMELAKQKLMGLYGVVPTLRAMDVRFACAKTDETSFDFVLTADFDDRDGLEAYRVHPAHRAVSAFMGAVREGRACVDFEI